MSGMQRMAIEMRCLHCRQIVTLDRERHFDSAEQQEAYIEAEIEKHLLVCLCAPQEEPS